ncbi:hypothetical protein C8Q70DRAFT_422985 [Cubamyces menziesii]|nr:hypothetical protein C8Q70DRAFT_422985 [Cubamyces menziesii]
MPATSSSPTSSALSEDSAADRNPSSSSTHRDPRNHSVLGSTSPPTTTSDVPSPQDAHPSLASEDASGKRKSSSTNPPGRRIRPKIALDPSQPPTALGKPRARVYVACNQCRTRKTRCDGAKPVCFHCRKRPPENGESCSYEAQPKRRGQDKAPGGRKRKRLESGASHSANVHGSDSEGSSTSGTSRSARGNCEPMQLVASYDNFPELWSDDSFTEYDPFGIDLNAVLDPPSTGNLWDLLPQQEEEAEPIPARPSLQFTRETWWDALLAFYASDDTAHPVEPGTLTVEQRSMTVRRIVTDLRALFHSSIYWVSFINIPRFFDNLLDPTRRAALQPSLLLSALAIGTLAQSSEAENGAPGRARALKLLDLADSTLQASLASGWVDFGLVQASWLIVYFEMQSHPLHSMERGQSSLLLLDSLLRLFSLTTLDAEIKKPSSATTLPGSFASSGSRSALNPALNPYSNDTIAQLHNSSNTAPYTAPLAPSVQSSTAVSAMSSLLGIPLPDPLVHSGPSCSGPFPKCRCSEFTIDRSWPSVLGFAPGWTGMMMWPTGLSEGEFRKEECRRLVWASIMMTASLNSYTSVTCEIEKSRLFIKDPRHIALLFPGESLSLAGTPVPNDNVWTLYLRAMLLLHSCVRMRADPTMGDAERAQFAMKAWLEIDALESALDHHSCGLERMTGFQAREMLFSARMCVSHEFQRYIPRVTTYVVIYVYLSFFLANDPLLCRNGSQLFYRDKAEGWLAHRMALSERVWNQVMKGEHEPAMDFRKPVLIYWFMSHIVKALVLWKADPTLTIALEASKTFAKRAEYIMMFWPSAGQRRDWQDLRYALVQACLQAGISPPERCMPRPIPRKGAPPAPKPA